MRTNIVIDDDLMERAQRASRLSTKRAVVEAGLAALIREERRRALAAAFGQFRWEGDLERMREGSPLDRQGGDAGSSPRP